MNDEPARRRRQRRLSDAERALWGEITHDIRPLRRAPKARDTLEGESEADCTPKPAEPARKQSKAAPPSRPQSTPPSLAPLGRRMRQRIARGSQAIGDRLDLHGMTQREAHDALLRFLRSARSRGVTLTLVITGKGAPATESGQERGVLKRQVPHWLQLPEFRALIVGFEPAHVTHGGEGALYVRIRRPRNKTN